LRTLTPEARQDRLDGVSIERRDRPLFDHLALDITRGGALTERNPKTIHLVAFEDFTGELGRLADTNRQHACRERIETADMTGFASAE